jgi:lipid-binding SYLF domain-containing protein
MILLFVLDMNELKLLKMKIKTTGLLLILLAFSVAGIAQKNSVKDAKKTITTFKKEDSGITKFFNSAYGYVVFPGIGKGGLGIGGAGGKGVVFKGGSAVADAKMSQITIGFQAGGQKYAEVIFFENAEAYERFVAGNYEFAAQVSAVALKSGASANAEYRDGMLVFTMAIGGLMYEASVGGQKFKVEMY